MDDELRARDRGGVHVETLVSKHFHRAFEQLNHLAAVPGLRRSLAASWAMWEQARGYDPDIVEACDWGLGFVAPVLEQVKPVVVQCHGSIGQIDFYDPRPEDRFEGILTRFVESSVIRSASMVQTVAEANAQWWRAQAGRDVLVLTPAWKPMAGEGAVRSPERAVVVGRVQKWKGPDVVCEAWEQLGASAPVLEWIGRDTPWGPTGRSSSQHLSMRYPGVWGTSIRPCPPLTPGQVRAKQAAALFNLIPSRWDAFNFTVIEALASGRPTIVSSGAGASDLIRDGVNGYLIPAGEPSQLARAVERVMAEPEERLREIGLAGQETVSQLCDSERSARTRIEVYQRVIDGFPANSTRQPSAAEELCRLKSGSPPDEWAFLNQYPSRVLLKNMARRLRAKLGLVFS